jgi:hypothetical protein
MVLVLGLTATALTAGFLVTAYCEWERKNAPRKASGYRDSDGGGDGGGLFDDLFGGDGDGDGGGDGGD